MKIILEEANPLSYLDELLELYRRAGKPKTREFFRWYYEDKGYGPPVSWLLREHGGRRLLGMSSVVLRRIRFGDQSILATIGGNLVVDADARPSMGAIQVLRAPQALASRRLVDVNLILRPNAAASKLSERLRYRPLGNWKTRAYVYRSRRWLRAKLGRSGIAVSPFVDLAATLHRAVMCRSVAERAAFEVRKLSKDDIGALAIEAWKASPGHFVGETCRSFLVQQFSQYPGTEHHVFGVFSRDSGQAVGIVVATSDESKGRAWIRYAAANVTHLSEAQAIQCVVQCNQRLWGIWRVEALEKSHIARDLARAGFVRAPQSRKTDPLRMMGYWRADHKLAAEFEQPANWSLFHGFNDV